MGEIKPCRLRRHCRACGGPDVFGERASEPEAAVDFVAHRELGDIGSDLHDDASPVLAEDQRKTSIFDGLEPVAHLPVDRVDAGRTDMHQHLVDPNGRRG
jgi:hypothetical protein